MNILILHSSSDLYGASNILLIVIRNLINNGHHPVVVLSEDGPLVEKLKDLKLEVRIIKLGVLRRKYYSVSGILNRIKTIRHALKALRELIKQKNIDLIYSNTTGVLVGALLSKKFKIRHIWHVHEIIQKPKIFSRVIGYLLNHYSERVIVVSDAVKYNWEYWVNNSKLLRIYNGINLKPFENKSGSLKAELNIPDNCLLIGMIGRVNHWKGQEYFIRLAAELSKEHPDVRFIMVGDAFPGYEYLYDHLKNLIKKENFADKIYNLGYRTDIVNILNSLDVFVLPSILPDPFPTVILEAMAAAKPVVATMQGGAIEMLEDGESGIFIPINKPFIAAAKISGLISNHSERIRIGENAKKRIENYFSIASFDKAMLQVFEKP